MGDEENVREIGRATGRGRVLPFGNRLMLPIGNGTTDQVVDIHGSGVNVGDGRLHAVEFGCNDGLEFPERQ